MKVWIIAMQNKDKRHRDGLALYGVGYKGGTPVFKNYARAIDFMYNLVKYDKGYLANRRAELVLKSIEVEDPDVLSMLKMFIYEE